MSESKSVELAREHELHQRIVDSLDQLPGELRGLDGDEHLLAWAHELRIHDSGRKAFADGSADILTVSERGQVWVIEVKLVTNNELNAGVWKQLIRYRDGLARMNWNDIHSYVDRFLEGEGVVKPAGGNFAGCRDLPMVIGAWQKRLGRRLMSPEDVMSSIANALRSGTAGLAVISDGYNSSVATGGEMISHSGPLAYVVLQPAGKGLKRVGTWYRPAQTSAGIQALDPSDNESFARYQKGRKQKLEVSGFGDELHPSVIPLWSAVVEPELKGLGWDGAPRKAERKGITISLPTRGRDVPMLRVAYSDSDSSFIPREFKLSGTRGLRVDLVAHYLTRCGRFSKAEIECFAERLYRLGWRGTGSAAHAGCRSLTTDEYDKWAYMRYAPTPQEKDFLGRPGEAKKLQRFFAEMKAFAGLRF